LAARIPFIAVLAMVLALLWYAAFHLARTEAAQPVSFAFGGEATTLDYARALADGTLLAMLASLGLLALGHETTPELLQLLGVSLWLYALAVAPYRTLRAQVLVGVALLILTLSGAAQFAMLLAVGGLLVCQFSRFDGARQLRVGLAIGLLLSLALALPLGLLRWRLSPPELYSLLRQLAWFTWPTAALAVWTLWRWRGFLGSRHVSVPMTLSVCSLLTWIALAGSDRALLLALPGLAVLASFALPTLNRSLSAMVDWFSVLFFSAAALFVWAYYLALHTSWLPRLSSNVARRFSGELQPSLDLPALLLAVAGTLGWLALVRWRTSRQRSALWRSLVLPAGGTATVWLLAMTLWLPAFDLARSNRALLSTLQSLLPGGNDCVAMPDQQLSLVSTISVLGRQPVRADQALANTECRWALRALPLSEAGHAPQGWQLKASVMRPGERDTRYQLLQRLPID